MHRFWTIAMYFGLVAATINFWASVAQTGSLMVTYVYVGTDPWFWLAVGIAAYRVGREQAVRRWGGEAAAPALPPSPTRVVGGTR